MEIIYFATQNKEKIREVKDILSDTFEVKEKVMALPEIQTDNGEVLIKRKAKDAFAEIRRPVLVEHTALEILAFDLLPGLQTSYFYQHLGYENIVNYCNYKGQYAASVKSFFCLCDGQMYLIGEGSEEGRIIDSYDKVDDKAGFDWDCIFIPKENNPDQLTYAQLGIEKNERSMRKRAWENLKSKINGNLNKCLEENTESKDIEELAALIKQKKVMLFVGAGLSASVGLPTWSSLMEGLARELEFDKDIFECYGEPMMLAEYADIQLKGEKLYEHVKKRLQITEQVKRELEGSDIYKALYELDFPVIYTTNYDQLIEEYYKFQGHKFIHPVINIEDMLENHSEGTRLMKFHGDINNRKSIVLTEKQYFERMDFRSFMDVQLQADMLHYHILFLGYSLSDINIKQLLYLARKRWADSKDKREKREHPEDGAENEMKAYIFTATPNQVQKEVFKKNGISSISGSVEDKEQGTLLFLEELLEAVREPKK